MFGGSTQTLFLFIHPFGWVLVYPQTFPGLLSSPFVTWAAECSCVETHLWSSSSAAFRFKLVSPGPCLDLPIAAAAPVFSGPVKSCGPCWHGWWLLSDSLLSPASPSAWNQIGFEKLLEQPTVAISACEWKQARWQDGNPGLLGRWMQNQRSNSWGSSETEVLIRRSKLAMSQVCSAQGWGGNLRRITTEPTADFSQCRGLQTCQSPTRGNGGSPRRCSRRLLHEGFCSSTRHWAQFADIFPIISSTVAVIWTNLNWSLFLNALSVLMLVTTAFILAAKAVSHDGLLML